MDLDFLPVNITYSLQLKFSKHLLDSLTILDFYQTWTEASYNHKIVSRGIFLLIFFLIFVEPAIYSKSRRDTGFRGTLTNFLYRKRKQHLTFREFNTSYENEHKISHIVLTVGYSSHVFRQEHHQIVWKTQSRRPWVFPPQYWEDKAAWWTSRRPTLVHWPRVSQTIPITR